MDKQYEGHPKQLIVSDFMGVPIPAIIIEAIDVLKDNAKKDD